MRRIRVALLLLSLAILAPVALLTWRALDGLAYERAVRHQVVAERVFEEMERSLSEFLAREEARPSAHYRFYLAESGLRSPLAEPFAEPFVLGAFEIDADGLVRTPLAPEDAELARARGDWPPPPEVERAIATIATAVAESYARSEDAPAQAQAPGTTRPLADASAEHDEVLAQLRAEQVGEREEATAYDVLQRFNRSARDRAERKQKLELEPSPESGAYGAAKSAPMYAGRVGAVAPPPRAPAEAGERMLSAPAPPAQAAPAPLVGKAARVQVAIDPMQGRLAGDGHLLLVRTVQVGRETLRQGLVLERDALGRWLEERTIGQSELERVARVAFSAADAPPPPMRADLLVFRHRFAEPFDGLAAVLALAPLPGVGGAWTVYALVGLLLAVGAGGVLALHRMVSVVVGFAERRSNFVAAVTHELKTPLTAIRMYAEMLRDGLVPSEAKRAEYTRTITDESERLSRLIDNVLEFARLERGRRELSLHAGAVAPVLEEALAKLASHAAREGFALELAVEPGLPPVRFDRDALLQVLFNLVDNAMKYARASGVRRVLLEARRAGDAVEVAVRDFGPGVAPKHLARIFEPFYRGEDELTRTTQGTGIGLALVRELATRMGVAVAGANQPDGGFRVSLAFQPAPGA